jgi:hypothetical protein
MTLKLDYLAAFGTYFSLKVSSLAIDLSLMWPADTKELRAPGLDQTLSFAK